MDNQRRNLCPRGCWRHRHRERGCARQYGPEQFNSGRRLHLARRRHEFLRYELRRGSVVFAPGDRRLPSLPPAHLWADPFSAAPQCAQLAEQVTPNGFPTVAWCEFGLTTNYGNITLSPLSAGAGFTPIFNYPIATNNFAARHQLSIFCAVASNSFGISYGTNMVFVTTSPILPTISHRQC